MNPEKENANVLIKKYYNFCFIFDNISRFRESTKIFQPFKENHSVTKKILNPNKKKENIIIIGDKDEELTKNSINSEFSEEKSSENEENGENINNYMEENKEIITIEIPKIENFLNKKRMFEVDRKKTGPKPKNSNSRSDHTKYSHDNISRKIKVKFSKNL